MLLVRAVRASHGEQMGRMADVPESSQTAHKEEGKAKEQGKEARAHHGGTIPPSPVRSSRSGYTEGQRKQTDCTCSGISQHCNCTKLLMNINADVSVCTAAALGWRFRCAATVLPLSWATVAGWQSDAPNSTKLITLWKRIDSLEAKLWSQATGKGRKGKNPWQEPRAPQMAPVQCLSSDNDTGTQGKR